MRSRLRRRAGAGTLVYVGRFDLAEFAVVLEPAEPLHTARRAFYAGMVALSDALRAYAPPNKPVTIDWPDAVRVDGGLVGGGRLGWPQVRPRGRDARLAGVRCHDPHRDDDAKPKAGVHPLASALEEEGFGEIGSVEVTESFARHLMVAFDRWQDDGFRRVARHYLRLPREEADQPRIETMAISWCSASEAEKAAPQQSCASAGKTVVARSQSGGPRL